MKNHEPFVRMMKPGRRCRCEELFSPHEMTTRKVLRYDHGTVWFVLEYGKNDPRSVEAAMPLECSALKHHWWDYPDERTAILHTPDGTPALKYTLLG